jgi:hypothetical protein
MRNPIFPKIESRIPNFITQEYPAAHKLIVDFYRWLETNENFIRVLTEFWENQEVNNQIEPYVDLIISELGWRFKRPLKISKSMLVSTLRDFYLSRGSFESFRYLFKVLFGGGEDVAISYPREKLFSLSDAKHVTGHLILTTANNFGSDKYERIIRSGLSNISIVGERSKTSLSVEEISPIVFNNIQYLQILVSESKEDFSPLENIIITDGETSVTETIFQCAKLKINDPGILYKPGDEIIINGTEIKGLIRVKSVYTGGISGINIVNGGHGYVVGDYIKAENNTKSGSGFFATVSEVGSLGQILKVKIWSHGYNYDDIPRLVVVSENGTGAEVIGTSTTIGGIKSIEILDEYWKFISETPSVTVSSLRGTGASFEIITNKCLSEKKLIFKNKQGVLGHDCFIHDSNYFQNFSYVITSRVDSSQFNDIVDDLVHPVGYKRFNVFLSETALPLNLYLKFNQSKSIRRIEEILIYPIILNSRIQIDSYLKRIGKSTIFSVNELDIVKFLDKFAYSVGDFGELIEQVLETRNETLESRTIDIYLDEIFSTTANNYSPNLGSQLTYNSYIEETKGSTIFSINNMDIIKFSNNFTYPSGYFDSLVAAFESREERQIQETIDPEISLV